MLGKIEGRRRKGRQRTRWLDSITDSRDMSLSKLWEMVKEGRPGVLQSMGHRELDTPEKLNNLHHHVPILFLVTIPLEIESL